ncbi:pregnancy zone protein isoform X2 [Andrena cerasifolii]|uniref:pregnancy zone protein isoform X2 n=1 Tax=Andrena cerasifolii TaxID=2819439 RepID=UPI0040384EFC
MSIGNSASMRGLYAMDRLVFLVLLVCSVAFFQSCGSTKPPSAVNRGYVFTAPNKFLAGETERGCLSLHNLQPPALVLLELLPPTSAKNEQPLASTSVVMDTGIEACLELMVPTTKYRKARLRLKIKFDNHPDYVVESVDEVVIEQDSLITFVETDKPVYKPGQDVNIRILTLKHDLKPWLKAIPKVWIENPSEIRVAQWTNVSTENGMAQLLFPLSPEPRSGTWMIHVEKEELYPQLVHTTIFEVKKYVLPRFQLTINSPGYILADTENVTWNICAKYSYGRPVKGTLLLKSTPETASWRSKYNFPEINYETELNSSDGCTEFVLSGVVLSLANWKVVPSNIVLIANFTEAGTGVVETAISWTMVMHQALKLEFEQYTPKYFKPGLPYHGKLRVLRQDNTPAPNEKIQVCLKEDRKDVISLVLMECRNFRSSADGLIDFIVPPSHKNVSLLRFLATGVDYPTKYYSPDIRWRVLMDQPSALYDVKPWFSPSDSYLAVARGYQPIVCGEKYSFNVMYTIPPNSNVNEAISFHYSINSKGDLLIYGHVKHKPSRDTTLNYSEFRNLLGVVESPPNNTDRDSVVHRFPLSVKITPSMAPVSELLLYYVRPDGEVVATTYTIEVGHCFENKVKSAWHTDVQTPGSATQYHVEAAPWSFCGVSAVDKSTLFVAGSKSNLVDADRTFRQLKRFHPTPKARTTQSWVHCEPLPPNNAGEEMDHLPNPFWNPFLNLRRRRRHVVYNGGVKASTYVDAVQAFDDFGVIVMSDLVLETRPCPIATVLRFKMRDISRMQAAGEGKADTFSIHSEIQPLAFPLTNFASAQPAMALEAGYVDELPDQTAAIRSYFPETWLWELVPTGKEGKVTIKRTLPHTITDWVGYTTCISPIHGLGMAPPTTITAFQPFFLDYSLPYSVKRGEMLRMKVSLFNYMQHSLPVKIKLVDAPGFDLHLSHPSASFCVEPRASVVHEYILRPRVIGEVNITVSASIDPDYAGFCGPDTLIFTRDVIVKPILVLPEGFPVEVTKSAFICPKDFSDDSAIVWDLILPENVVPDSGRAYVNLVGDILGPAHENLDKLVQLPVGCGEQNMVLLVPNIHVIRYLDAVGIENLALKARAIKNIEKGYQRELNYRHPDGSYSAFGTNDSEDESSIWLTAFVLKSFAQAQSLIHIDERDLIMSAEWIVKKQLKNGCFPVVGRVFHKNMKGGLQEDDSSSALTAYILISLIESKVPLPSSLVKNASQCLENGMASNDDGSYTMALFTYALALLEHPNANSSMKSLIELATHQNDLLWWEDKAKPSLSLSIEITAYAILTLVKLGGGGNMVQALKAVRWLSKQRNAEGGFISTQDTVLGLEALTKYAAAMNGNNADLSVLVVSVEVDHAFRMHNDNRMVLTQIRLPVLPTMVEIFAEGEGCVMVQTNMKYNVAYVTGSDAFNFAVHAKSLPFANECSMQEITICARYKMADEESNMALLEVGMISGYVPDRASLHALLRKPSTRVKRFEEDHDVVTIYFDKLTNEVTCISFTVVRKNVVDRLEPANVKLYDYYQQELTISKSYNFAPTCSSADPTEEQPPPQLLPEVKINNMVSKSLPGDELSVLEARSDSNRPMEKSAKDMVNESGGVNEKLKNQIDEENGKSTSLKGPSLVNKFTENVANKREKQMDIIEEASIVGVQPKVDNVPLVDNSNPKINEDDSGSITTTNGNGIASDNSNTPQVESGSGLTPDEPDTCRKSHFDNSDSDVGTSGNADNPSAVLTNETDDAEFPPNPSFVVINHEMETPQGIEGPMLVYVNPTAFDYKTEAPVGTNGLSDLAPTPRMENENISQEESDGRIKSDADVSHVSSPTRVKQFCPICVDELPSDISNVYCSARSAVKVAIRRLRKARLLLDLHPSRDVRRLRATKFEFTLNPNCFCTPLDSPGSLALILNKDDDFLASGDHKQMLNESFYIYGLPSISGEPFKVTDARPLCSNQQKNQSDYVDPPAGG